MSQIQVIGLQGGRSIELELPEVRAHVLHEVVSWQLAKRRAGTASTKTRAQVNVTGKKMYGQKGTGNARHGDRSVPTFVGGGVAFGPKPRSYAYTLPKKVRQLGLAMALKDRLDQGKLVAVDGFGLDGKTKGFVAWAKEHGMDGLERILVVTEDALVLRAVRNLPWVNAMNPMGLNVYDILRHERLVIDANVLEPAHSDDQSAGQEEGEQ